MAFGELDYARICSAYIGWVLPTYLHHPVLQVLNLLVLCCHLIKEKMIMMIIMMIIMIILMLIIIIILIIMII